MCKRYLTISITCVLTTTGVAAQSTYKDSITTHRLQYKTELVPVIKNDTAFIRFYPPNETYRVLARVDKLQGEKFFPMATSSGEKNQAIRYAKLTFLLRGKEHTLYAYQLSFLLSMEKHKNNFFIPFTDGTSGTGSYPGGKYIDFTTSDIAEDNTLLIDFNRSYNPYCAFSSGYSCPIPPKENTLLIDIRAGEMGFGKKQKTN